MRRKIMWGEERSLRWDRIAAVVGWYSSNPSAVGCLQCDCPSNAVCTAVVVYLRFEKAAVHIITDCVQ